MTVFSTFILAPALGEAGIIDPTTAALACPIAMQWLSAPIHLLGLDMYLLRAIMIATCPHFL